MFARRLIPNIGRPYPRSFSTNAAEKTLYDRVRSTSENCSEVEINVPWGQISGKLWGSTRKQPILAIHGWEDNAGTFDRLAPLLASRNSPVLAIDLPGHGLSSWLPPGLMYDEGFNTIVIERLRRHFRWERVKILGSSFGGLLCFVYGMYFPRSTYFAISMDAFKPRSIDVHRHNEEIASSIGRLLNRENAKTLPVPYTEDEIIDKWSLAVFGGRDVAACRIYLTRGARKTEDGKFIFTRDPRLKQQQIMLPATHEYLKKSAERITCPYLVLKAKDFPYTEETEKYYDVLNVMREFNEHLQHEIVPGNHHFHLLNTEAVANVIYPFLDKYDA